MNKLLPRRRIPHLRTEEPIICTLLISILQLTVVDVDISRRPATQKDRRALATSRLKAASFGLAVE